MKRNVFKAKIKRLDVIERTIKNLEAEYRAIAEELISGNIPEEVTDGRQCSNCKQIKSPSSFHLKSDGTYTKTCEDCLVCCKKSKRRLKMIAAAEKKAEALKEKIKPVVKRESLEDFINKLKKEGKSYQEIQKAETLWMQKEGIL